MRWYAPIPAILALLIIAAGWLSTTQSTIGAGYPPVTDPEGMIGALMDDSGEFVIAWNRWGVTHPPGYPLLNLLGNLFVRFFRLFGASPILASSLISWMFAVSAFMLIALIVLRVDRVGLGAAAAVLLPAFGLRTWLYASVAESYALGFLLAFGLMYLALSLGTVPTRGKVLLLGFLFGLAVVHHRTLLALAPALAFAAWPSYRLGWKTWIGAAATALLSTVIYIYLPLSALSGSPWIYGRSPATWEGFIDAVAGREYSDQIGPPMTLPAIAAALIGRVDYLAREMNPAGVILGTVGLFSAMLLHLPSSADASISDTAPRPLLKAAGAVTWLARINAWREQLTETQRTAITAAIAIIGFLFAPVGQYLLIGTHLLVMVTCMVLGLACGLGVASLSRRSLLAGIGALVVTGISAGLLYREHRAGIEIFTEDILGQQMIDAVEALENHQPVVVESWGPRYFALAYGKYVTRELAEITLHDARLDMAGLPPSDSLSAIYTTQDFLYVAGPERWEQYFGKPVVLSSAGDRLVKITTEPELVTAVDETLAGTGDISLEPLRAWMEGGDVRLRVRMIAVQDSDTDYHVFVHISEQDAVTSQEDILVQGDRAHPVYGFYPTSQWPQGAVIYDDYRIAVPDGSQPRIAVIGLYTVEADGSFINHVVRTIPIQSGE